MTDNESENRGRGCEKPADNQKEANREREKAAEYPDEGKIVGAILGLGEKIYRQGDENTPQKRRERCWQHAEVIGLWVAAAVGLFAIIVANRDASDQRTVLQTQQKVMQAQLEQMRADQRAFVTVSELREMRETSKPNNGGWFFQPIFQNSGSTPTRNFRAILLSNFAAAENDLGPMDPGINFNMNDRPGYSLFHALIGAHAALIMPGASMPPNFVGPVLSGKMHAYVVGAARYTDIPSNKEHLLKFCYAINGPATPADEGKPNISLCGHWNCADEECQDDRSAAIEDMKRIYKKRGWGWTEMLERMTFDPESVPAFLKAHPELTRPSAPRPR